MDESLISETLESASDGDTARKAARQVHTLRGLRGTPQGEIARIAAAVWRKDPPSLEDEGPLSRLFSTAWEDGIVAVGLLAALVPDGPGEAFDIAREWLGRIDDLMTADALGWLVLGPAFAASGADAERLDTFVAELRQRPHPAVRRAGVAMGLAFLPIPIQGPSAAPLRERLGEKALQFVAEPLSPLVHVIAHRFLRDEDPAVRKALRRLLREWVRADPAAVVHWESTVRGGLPKMLSAETKRAHRKAS
ncbi:MAG: DNA alkylation repair protein [Alphaproteobacteria bacterium]|nr:DNA alkylation repair protein [Alphaproteobacteria bacterium]